MNDKKEAILSATLSCLSEGQSPNEVKMAELARRAGVGKGTVYEYFPSKEELFAQSILTFIEASVERIRRAGKDGSFQERFFRILRVLSDCLEHNRPLFHVVFLHQRLFAGSEISSQLQKQQPALQEELAQTLTQIVSQGEKEGLFPPPGERDALFAFTCITGALSFADCSPVQQDRQELFDLCYQKFLKLLR